MKHQLFTKLFIQKAVEQQQISGGSLKNEELDEVPSPVVVVGECF